ncbi:MAG: HDOD domain-containing protein [Anaerolineae bacterium]|nr:HDOD domain-containing protein [Anaerolineae bacterium]
MKRVLLVGNNGGIDPQLQKALCSPQHEWEVDLITGGQQALEQLSRGCYDAIVCHNTISGLSGVNLLEITRKHYPNIMRFMLSEASSTDERLKIVNSAHQILPLNNQASFVSIIQRAFSLNSLLQQTELKRLISKLRNLPSLPVLYTNLMNEIETPEVSLERIGGIISRDPAMSAKILQLVNSPFFGISRSVVNPVQATALLGVDIIRGLILCINIFSQFNPITLEKLGISTLWDHSIHTGSYAKIIARTEHVDEKIADFAFTGGILHDIGKLVLADNLPVQYFSALGTASRKGIELYEAERDVFGTDHSQVGAYLLGLWGLPQPIVEAVAFHHRPLENPTNTFNALSAIHSANYIEHQLHPANWTPKNVGIQTAYLEKIKLTNRVDTWVEACQD